jgi:hypothetical protein
MKGIKNRLEKIEASYRIVLLPDFGRMTQEQTEAWFEAATDEQSEAALRKLVALWKGCTPEEVDLSPENQKAMMEELETEKREAGAVIMCKSHDLSK